MLDAEELRRRLEKLQEETPIMDLTKLRGEVERLEPSQSVAFTELPGAPAVPQESPGPHVVGPRRRQMAMRFGPQPMPQAPKPPPPTAPTPSVAPNPSSSFISFTDPKSPPPEEIPQIKASDILPQAPTPPPPVPPPLPKSPFIFSSQLQPPTPEAQFQSVSLPQSPFSTAFTSLPPQSNIKPSQPSEPYIPSPQGYSLPPTDRSEIEKLLWDRQEEPEEPSGPSGPSGQPQQTNYRQIIKDRRAKIISDMGYPPIDEIQKITSVDRIYDTREELKHDIRIQTGTLVGLQNKKNKTTEDEINIAAHKDITDAMVNYRNKLLEHVKILEELEEEEEEEEGEEWVEEARRELFGEGRAQGGQGIKYFNSPAQLFDRLELLAGSISAGNNGVANEFTEIAHVLRNMGILTQTALNKLLRKFILGK